MSVRSSRVWRLVAIAALVLTLVINSLASDHASASAASPPTCATPAASQFVNADASPTGEIDDLAVIDGMIRLQAEAVALANVGLQLAQDSDVRRMALRVAESQAGEIQLLKSWRSAWFPASSPLQLEVAEPLYCGELQFDQWFLIQMRDRLTAQVTLASVAADSADHAELRDFARSTVEMRSSELRMIETLIEKVSAAPMQGS